MRLKQHIQENRSQVIDVFDSVDDIKRDCQQAIEAYQKGHRLYRGISTHGDMRYIEPKKHTRESRNTQNSYTLIIDNSPKWKSYPKRSQSIICASSVRGASPYGSPYCIFPKDGANFGVCPRNDIWSSFAKVGVIDLADFNYDIFEKIPMLMGNGKRVFKDLSSLKKVLKMMDGELKDFDFGPYKRQFSYMLNNYNGDLWKMMNELIDPKKNRFYQTTDMMSLPTDDVNHEVWTDSPSYMVNEIWMRQNFGQLVDE